MPTREPYRPSNGTEGEIFRQKWCDRCEKDRYESKPCDILTRTMGYDAGDPKYPKEWTVTPGTGWPGDASCSAFVEIGTTARKKASRTIRDRRQVGLFNGAT